MGPIKSRAEFGKALQTRRKALGLTQVALAKRLGVQNSHLCRWESGVVLPTPDNLFRILNVLGLEMHLLPKGGPEDGSATRIGP